MAPPSSTPSGPGDPDEADRVVQTNRWVHVPDGTTPSPRSAAIPTGDAPSGPLDGNGTNYKPFARSLPGCSFPSTQATDWIADRQIYDRVGRVVQRQGNPSPTVAPVAGLASGSPVPLSKTTYDGLGRAIKTVDALGNTNESWFDASGNVVETRRTDVSTAAGTNSATFLDTRFYDALDRLVLEVDNAGHATDLRYDGLGRLAVRSDARGPNPSARTLPRRSPGASPANVSANDFGNVTLTSYDARGRRVREDKVLTVSGTGDGQHLGTPLLSAPVTTSTHPVNLGRIAVEAPLPLPDAKTGPDHPGQGGGDGLITVRYEYDVAGRLTALIDDNGNETDWSYDCQGRKVSETKGSEAGPVRAGDNTADVPTAATTIQWTYDAATGRLDHMTREDGSRIDYGYDTRNADRLTSVTVLSSASVTPPLVGTTQQNFTYDGPGRRIGSTDNNDPATSADDAVCAWRYDSLGRTIEESQQLGATGSVAVVSYQYKANDRAALVYPNGRTTGFTYHIPGGPLHALQDLDANGNPVAGPAIAAYDYLGGRTLVRAMQNGVNLDLRDTGGAAFFDATGRPTKWLHRDTNQTGSPTKIGFEYAYDANANKQYQKSVHDPLDSQRYAYDSADRLTACVRGPFGALPEGFCGPSTGTWAGQTAMQSWDLDGSGNWKHLTSRIEGTSATVKTLLDDTVNFYANVDGVQQTRDANGNLTDNGKRVLKWDGLGRLREVWTTTGTLVARYTYDADHRRLLKQLGAASPRGNERGGAAFAYAGWRVMEECDLTTTVGGGGAGGTVGAPLRQYVYGEYLDDVLAMDTDQNGDGNCAECGTPSAAGPDRRLFFHSNTLYSPGGLTDLFGRVVEGYAYDPYGERTVVVPRVPGGDTDFSESCGRALATPSNYSNCRAFTGQFWDDETGWGYYERRYLDGAIGHFQSGDPEGLDDAPNLYVYVSDGPTGRLDPTGMAGMAAWSWNPKDDYTVARDPWMGTFSNTLGTTKHWVTVQCTCVCAGSGYKVINCVGTHHILVTFPAHFVDPYHQLFAQSAEKDHVIDYIGWKLTNGTSVGNSAVAQVMAKTYSGGYTGLWEASNCEDKSSQSVNHLVNRSADRAQTRSIAAWDTPGWHTYANAAAYYAYIGTGAGAARHSYPTPIP